MATRAFDTLEAAKTLEEAGFERAQAEAVVATVTSVVRLGIEAFARDLVTRDQFSDTAAALHADSVEVKGDFAQLKGDFVELRGEFAELKGDFVELRGEFAELKGDFVELRGEFAELKGDFVELRGEFAELKGDFVELRAEMHAGFAELRAEFALEIKNLYRHLWLMSASIVALTVTLTKLIP